MLALVQGEGRGKGAFLLCSSERGRHRSPAWGRCSFQPCVAETSHLCQVHGERGSTPDRCPRPCGWPGRLLGPELPSGNTNWGRRSPPTPPSHPGGSRLCRLGRTPPRDPPQPDSRQSPARERAGLCPVPEFQSLQEETNSLSRLVSPVFPAASTTLGPLGAP